MPQTFFCLRGLQRAEAAAAGDLEHRLRALGDVLERELLALRGGRVGEVVRVVDEHLEALVDRLGAGSVAGDPVVDRRDLLAADRAEHELALRLAERADLGLRHLGGEVADEEAGLLRLERQPVRVRSA